MNQLYEAKTPFFFISDFLCNKNDIIPLTDAADRQVFFAAPNYQNIRSHKTVISKKLQWKKQPTDSSAYKIQFENVQKEIQAGNTYLLNLTCATPITTNYNLEELFYVGKSKYKLWYKDQFVHFSPEPFVKIESGKIYAFPMKGTIDASLKDAAQTILRNEKELSEQFTIVDLIRNDLSIVAQNIQVEDFRYLEKIETNQKELLSVSSKISGNLRSSYLHQPGNIFAALLPAGSICGAPKAKTVDIILQTENYERGWYTGVWGVFDGKTIDSCVIIRYLENTPAGMVFKSGGGITAKSNWASEYEEMVNKIYVPIY